MYKKIISMETPGSDRLNGVRVIVLGAALGVSLVIASLNETGGYQLEPEVESSSDVYLGRALESQGWLKDTMVALFWVGVSFCLLFCGYSCWNSLTQKNVSSPNLNPNPDSLTLEMLEAKMKGLQALVATLAEHAVNSKEGVLEATIAAQAQQIEGLTQWKEEALRAQLALRTQVSTLGTELDAARVELARLAENGVRLDDRMTGVTTRVDGLEETTTAHSRAIRDIQYFLPEIVFQSGVIDPDTIERDHGGRFEIPVPEGVDRKDAAFFWTNGACPAPSYGRIREPFIVSLDTGKHFRRVIGLSGVIFTEHLRATSGSRDVFWSVTAVRYPFRARLDEDAREAAASSAAASATSGKG